MNDLMYTALFFCLFGAALMGYGAVLARTANKRLLPYRVIYTIRNRDDVRRVGRVTATVGCVILALSAAAYVFARLLD